jgi:hypothetical protein
MFFVLNGHVTSTLTQRKEHGLRIVLGRMYGPSTENVTGG